MLFSLARQAGKTGVQEHTKITITSCQTVRVIITVLANVCYVMQEVECMAVTQVVNDRKRKQTLFFPNLKDKDVS